MPSLRSRAGELTGITIRDGADTFAIERRGGEFVAADSGFPIRLDALREVVTQSAGLTFNDARTSDPGRYSELGLADTGDGSGKEIVFRAGNGDIADIVVGNNDTTAGSAGGGQFVRIKGQPQTWLARGTVRVPANRTGWYANVDFDTKRSEIKKVTLSGGTGETITIAADAKKPGEFDLENVPEKREPDAFKVSRLATLFDAFSFQDVRKRTAPARRRRAAHRRRRRRRAGDPRQCRQSCRRLGPGDRGAVGDGRQARQGEGDHNEDRRFRIPPAEPAGRGPRLEFEGRDDRRAAEAGRTRSRCGAPAWSSARPASSRDSRRGNS